MSKSWMNSELFTHYQSLLEAQFKLATNKFSHCVEKGTNVEAILSSFLEEFLPESNFIGNGTTLDSFNHRSGQLDIVIGSKDLQPFIKNYHIPNLFIIEAVRCVGEVKTNLSNLEKVLVSCRKFKKLTAKSPEGTLRCTNPSDAPRFFERRPYFLFCFNSRLKISTIIDRLTKYYVNTSILEQIDAIFILGKGAIINFGDGQGGLQFINQETSELGKGFIYAAEKNDIIKTFVGWLSIAMPMPIYSLSPLNEYILKYD